MMRAEREELLRRYLEEEMSLEQEHDFIIQAALDKELRHELKAQQTIDRAFQKDRVVDPSAYASLQTSVAGMIGAIAVEHPVVPEKTGTVLSRFLNNGRGRWVFGGLLGIGLLAGLLLLVLPGEDPVNLRQPTSKTASTSPVLQDGQNRSSQRAGDFVMPQERALRQESQGEMNAELNSAAATANRSGAMLPSRSGERSTPSVAPASGSRSGPVGSPNRDTAVLENGAVLPTSTQQPNDKTTATPVNNHGAQSVEPAQNQDSLNVGVRLRWKK